MLGVLATWRFKKRLWYSDQMKVVVLGAAGAMAAVTLRDLLEFVPDIRITAADSRPLSIIDPRITPATVDVRDIETTARLLQGHDVVINAVTYYLNVPVMQAALKARVPYIDLGGLYHGSLKQFELQDAYSSAGVTALLGMGSTPGITNVMAGALAARMDRVEQLHVRVACHDNTASGPLPVPYALDTVLDEFSLQPYVFENGSAHPVPPMSGSEELELPPPVHRAEALYTLHSEVAMFPRSFPGLKDASFKVAFPAEFVSKVRFLVELGFSSAEKAIGDVSPRQMLLRLAQQQPVVNAEPADCDVLRVIARGQRKGRSVTEVAESVILPHRRWRIAAGALDTGVPLSIGAQMLARGIIRTPGVLCPETAVPADDFFHELSKREMAVSFRSGE